MSSDPDVPVDPSQGKTDAPPPPPAGMPLTRAGALWSALIAGFLVLIVLLVFVTQNTKPADLTFLAWTWSLPLGVAILLAAIGGGLITALVGTARIFQLRRAAKKSLAARR
ncbi:LapA family protein [[Mycobacterium] nativiensis]|uniref:Lipopolysaccharide assembly protein LapA domain-containing protein n=1 Tax=[Mycobacterium] nativiensis TaxID=2855503 RepID=A0ABU5Y3L0_9MYCO|nr:lipopolysaccharide assembly protein LapA domain-containing protein [Mycolicibacter sp. MYC340]MEB3034814.1 lipopolysaccharide assembly protein LapA domain-containing protein [Mycolicibacter sp. MYC340]